jgi:hypothetical protein
MTQDTLFGGDKPQTPTVDETKNYVEELVGEGKKFKDLEALARSVLHKDAFIEQLKSETAGLREDLNTRLKMEDFLAKLNPPAQDPAPGNQTAPPSTEKTATTREDILKLLDERDAALARQRNLNEAKATLEKNFGPNYASRVREIATQLGADEAFLNNLAATNPAALYKLVGVGERRQEGFEAPPRGASPGFTPTGKAKNYAYYENLRKENASQYWSPATQNEMFREAERQGDAFYSKG